MASTNLPLEAKSAAWLEAEALRVCHGSTHLHHLKRIKIEPLVGPGRGWQVAGFEPELVFDGLEWRQAMKLISQLRSTYTLARIKARSIPFLPISLVGRAR
jgi:hypothetical protein